MDTDYVEKAAAVVRDMDGEAIYTVHLAASEKLGFPLWSQRDPEWSDHKLGNSQWTLGQRGCLVVAVAMGVTKALQQTVTPSELNSSLTSIGGFLSGGELIYTKVSELYAPDLPFADVSQYITIPAPIDKLLEWVDAGDIVVAKVDHDTTSPDIDQHWVLIVGGTKDELRIHDPWTAADNQRVQLLPPAYCRRGWSPARAVYGHARYRVRADT